MSRLIAVSKGLYYPTPLRVVAQIARKLSWSKLVTIQTEGRGTWGEHPSSNMAEAGQAGQVLRILDPCAGRGSAALFLARLLSQQLLTRPDAAPAASKQAMTKSVVAKTKVELFGIELDRERAALAAPNFTAFLQTNALTAKVEPKAFDLLFHNPPYHGAPRHA